MLPTRAAFTSPSARRGVRGVRDTTFRDLRRSRQTERVTPMTADAVGSITADADKSTTADAKCSRFRALMRSNACNDGDRDEGLTRAFATHLLGLARDIDLLS